MVTWQIIHDDVHWLSDGIVNIVQSFTGNTLSVTITASEYKDNQQIIGWLYLYSGFTEKRYALVTFDEVIALVLPECDRIEFRPTKFLSDTFGLKLAIANVDNGSNANNASVSIPAIILGLPDRVASLEGVEPPNFTSQFTGIDNRLDILESIPVVNFAPDILSINNRLGALESVPIPSFNNVVLSANGTLQSYKSYFAGVANLAVSLPVNPNIGDTIELTTGNYDLRVFHGNASQVILNSNTQTLVGASSGIMLKPFSSIKLLLVAANLWISTIRIRNINNFIPSVTESSATFKSYAVTSTNASLSNGTTLNSIFNGVKTPTGSFATDGLLNNTQVLNLLLTFNQPILLDQLRVWSGQGNVFSGFSNFAVANVIVYRGNDTANQIADLNFSNSTGVQQNRDINSAISSNTYLLVFNGGSNSGIGILELEAFGRGAIGGEVSVI